MKSVAPWKEVPWFLRVELDKTDREELKGLYDAESSLDS